MENKLRRNLGYVVGMPATRGSPVPAARTRPLEFCDKKKNDDTAAVGKARGKGRGRGQPDRVEGAKLQGSFIRSKRSLVGGVIRQRCSRTFKAQWG